jgi:integrase
VFVTLTAPSFGPVHARREKDGRVLACRPRRKDTICPHGIGLSCGEKHERDDHRLLRWKDVDLDGKKITITGSTAVIGGERVNGTTKSGRTRVISVDDETVAVLRERKADQAAEQLKAGDSWHGTTDGYVFATGWGEPIYPDTVTSLMTKLIRASKHLPHARLHDLRHLHATTLLLSGVPVHVVAAWLGHADPAITLRVYAHVIRSAEAAAADIFARAVKTAC